MQTPDRNLAAEDRSNKPIRRTYIKEITTKLQKVYDIRILKLIIEMLDKLG